MNSDISRQTFDSKKHYSQVVMQQGRVQLDADWNEQQDMLQYRLEMQTRDMIGQSGVPQIGGGFEVKFTPDGRDLIISPGRIYVDGILCELDATTIDVESIIKNPGQVKCSDIDNRAFQVGRWAELLDKDGQRLHDKNGQPIGLFQITGVKINKDNRVTTLSTDQTNFDAIDQQAYPLKLRDVLTYTTQPDYPNPEFTKCTEPTISVESVEHHYLRVKRSDVRRRVFQEGQSAELFDKDGKQICSFQLTRVKEDKGLVILYTEQADFDTIDKGAYPLKMRRIDLRELDFNEKHNLLLVYLDVWQRHITALDDARIREVALDGSDTSARIQTLWQVKILPLKLSYELEKLLKDDADKLIKHAELGSSLKALTAKALTSPGSKTSSRIQEKHAEQKVLLVERERLAYEIVRCLSDNIPDAWRDLLKNPTGHLNVTTYEADKPGSSGYLGLQNQLYRVEIHEVAADETPLTFKWARDNASIASLVEVKGDTVIVPGTGQGGILNYSRGQFAEVVSDQTEFNAVPGKLAQISKVDTLSNQLTLDSSLGSDGAQIKIRLWDGKGDIGKTRLWDGKDSTSENDTWISLDGGIMIQFSKGTYKNGDYWLIPARTSTKEIEWPPYQVPNTHPLPQTRSGTLHHYSRLAYIRLYQGQEQGDNRTTYDCRRRFTSLPDVIDAMHVVKIIWDNDEIYTHKDLEERGRLKDGLKIDFDAKLDKEYIEQISASMIVTIETATLGGGKEITVINGKLGLENDYRTITWRWHEDNILPWFRNLLSRIFNNDKHPVRVRITLKGRTIWSKHGNRLIYLDGQAFGIPAKRADGKPRIDLALPSGADAKASDFESWFYLRYE